MGFGMRAFVFCIPTSFPFPGERGLSFLGPLFELVVGYSQ
jgi:hypothetical protein